MTVALGRSTIDVLSVGACAPAGLDALEVATAVRARRFEPTYVSFSLPAPDAPEEGGNRVGAAQVEGGGSSTRRLLMCRLAGLPADCLGTARLLGLGAPALREACVEVGSRPLPLLLATAEPWRPGAEGGLPSDFLDRLAAEAGLAIDRGRSRLFEEGHAGAASAFAAAIELLEAGDVELAVVGGIDSYHQPKTVDWLLREGLGGGSERFVPSEGAAFLLLAPHRPDHDRRPLARLCAAMTDRIDEQVLIALTPGAESAGSPNASLGRTRRALGEALAATPSRAGAATKGEGGRDKGKPRAREAAQDAQRAATEIIETTGGLLERLVAAWPGVPIEWVLSDVNNAKSRVHEWQLASRRALPLQVTESRLIDQLGDVGAASGAMLAVIACAWWRIGCAPATSSLIALHSQLAERGVVLLRRAAAADDHGPSAGGPSDAPEAAAAPEETTTGRAATTWLDELGQLLLAVPDGIEGREAVVAALDAAMAAVLEIGGVAPGDDRAVSLLDVSLARIDEAHETLGSSPAGRGRIGERLAALRQRLARQRPQLVEEAVRRPLAKVSPTAAPRLPTPFRASGDTAALHHLLPGRLGAFVTASPNRAFDPDESPRRASRRQAAERHLQAIARLSQTRRATDLFPWSPSLATFDETLLSHLDAFAALGEHLPNDPDTVEPLDELARFAAGSRSDPDRAFVRAFVLGCQRSKAAVRALVLALRDSDPVTHAAQAEALALASSPAIDEAMAQLCQDGDARMVRLALDVLGARRSVSYAHVCPLLWHGDPSIRRKAVAVLAYAHDQREAVLGVLEPILYDDLDDQTVAAAAQTLLVLDVPRALDLVRQRLSDDVGQGDSLSRRARRRLLVLLALGGGRSDLDLLLAAALPTDADALGWFGHVGAIEPLLALLEDDQPAPRRRRRRTVETPRQKAARALRRITGATPPATGVRHRRRPEAVDSDPSFWRSWWSEHRGELDAATRYRWGKPYEPSHTIDELRAAGVAAHLRSLASTELSLLTVDMPPPWEGDWVGRQLRVLTALENLLRARERPLAPGQWPASTLGRRARRARR